MAIAIDGTATGTATNASSVASGAFTTAGTNRICVAVIHMATNTDADGPSVSSISGGGLTWVKRSAHRWQDLTRSPISHQRQEVWWALAAATQSGITVTVTLSGTNNDAISLMVYGVSGADTTTPWETNKSCPHYNNQDRGNGYGGSPCGVVSTDTANTMLFIFQASDRVGAFGLPSTFTAVTNVTVTGTNSSVQSVTQLVLSAIQTHRTPDVSGDSGKASSGIIMDAMRQAAEGAGSGGTVIMRTGGSQITCGGTGTATLTPFFTSDQTNTIIVVVVCIAKVSATSPTVSTVADANSLTWTKRTSQAQLSSGGHGMDQEVWWAFAAAAQFGNKITVTFSATPSNANVQVMQFIKVDTSNPFDPNGLIPHLEKHTASATSGATVSTNNANTLMLGLEYTVDNLGLGSAGATAFVRGPYSDSATTIFCGLQTQYKLVSSTQTTVTDSCGFSTVDSCWISDALQQASAGSVGGTGTVICFLG
jgi:hypothetical protein